MPNFGDGVFTPVAWRFFIAGNDMLTFPLKHTYDRLPMLSAEDAAEALHLAEQKMFSINSKR